MVNVIADKYGAGANGLGVSIEPITSFFPEVGPNAHHLFRKIQRVFDPNDIYIPGRQIFNKAEYDAFPAAGGGRPEQDARPARHEAGGEGTIISD